MSRLGEYLPRRQESAGHNPKEKAYACELHLELILFDCVTTAARALNLTVRVEGKHSGSTFQATPVPVPQVH